MLKYLPGIKKLPYSTRGIGLFFSSSVHTFFVIDRQVRRYNANGTYQIEGLRDPVFFPEGDNRARYEWYGEEYIWQNPGSIDVYLTQCIDAQYRSMYSIDHTREAGFFITDDVVGGVICPTHWCQLCECDNCYWNNWYMDVSYIPENAFVLPQLEREPMSDITNEVRSDPPTPIIEDDAEPGDIPEYEPRLVRQEAEDLQQLRVDVPEYFIYEEPREHWLELYYHQEDSITYTLAQMDMLDPENGIIAELPRGQHFNRYPYNVI